MVYEVLLSDPMYGYREREFTEIILKDSLKDLEKLLLIANHIENKCDPYDAARSAHIQAVKYKLENFMKALSLSSMKKATISDKRFRSAENDVALSFERAPNATLQCLKPGCSNLAIRRSHAIQKKRVMERISGGARRVYQTKVTPFNDATALVDISWSQASTFPGFCNTCENDLFSEFESQDFRLTRRGLGMLIWRSACLTRFRRSVEVQARGKTLSKPDMYALSMELDDHAIIASSALIFKSRIHSFQMLDEWTRDFEKSNFGDSSKYSYVVVKIPELPFVSSGIIPLHFDFSGSRLQVSDNFNKPIQFSAFTTCVVDDSLAVVFCARRSDKQALKFCQDVKDLDRFLLSSYLPQILVGSSDTVYLSIDYWEKTAKALDRKIFTHAQFMNFPKMVFPAWGPMTGVRAEDIVSIP